MLGDNSTTQRLTPVAVSGLSSGVVAITAGGYHACALTSGGAAKCWGEGGYGQLGNNIGTTSSIPVAVSGLSSGVVAVTAGYYDTCAQTSVGAAKCWGFNNHGQVGDNTTTARWSPVSVVGLSSGVTTIAVGDYHTCALIIGGAAKCWGYNGDGELGDTTTTDRWTPVSVIGL